MSTKGVQGKLWSVAPQYWSQHFEPWFLPLYRRVLKQLELTQQHTVLDAGCGSGMFSALAIQAGAQLTGVDAAEGLLEIARRRSPNNNFLEEDIESLPFKDASFDVVVGFNSFQYAGSFDNALVEATRVLKKGGRMVIGVWDKPEFSDASYVLKAINSLLPPPPSGTPGPFVLSEDGKIESSLHQIGLKLIHKSSVQCPFIYNSLDSGIKSFMSTGPAATAINITDLAKVEKTIAQALKPFSVTEDFYFLQNQFLGFIAEK